MSTPDRAVRPRKKRYLTSLRATAKEINSLYNEYQAGLWTDTTDFRAAVYCLRSLAEVLKMAKDVEEFDERITNLEERIDAA